MGLVLRERGDSFRGLVMRVLYYLSLADRSKLGLILAGSCRLQPVAERCDAGPSAGSISAGRR